MSILNVLSKVLERAVHSQLSEYLERRDLLFLNQSGFRGGFSTDTSLTGLSDFVKKEIGRGNFVGMVLIDLQKAFDTVDHDILIDKLQAVGVDGSQWFRSYLTDRRQCVDIGGTRSDFLPVSCGVPQGSILGPLLFLVYINDMAVSLDCMLSLYADDSALLFSHRDSSVIAERLSIELTACKKWLVDNRLSLHVGKTESILFGSGRRLKGVGNFSVHCDGMPVQRNFEVKYLGVLLDDRLTGSAHVSKMLKTCMGRLSFLYRNSSFLDSNCRKLLCSSLIQPYLDYCSSSWYSGVSAQLRSRMDVLQRKMARFIFGFDYRAHIGTTELRSLSWLTVPDRVSYFKLIQLFKIRLGSAPHYLISDFKLVSESHIHATRGSRFNYQVPKSLALAPTTFSFTVIKQWNSLPTFLKEIKSLPSFKRKLKEYLLSRY